MSSPSYAVLAASEDPTTATALCTLLTEADTHLSTKAVSTLAEAIDSQAEVLVLYLAVGPLLDLMEELIQHHIMKLTSCYITEGITPAIVHYTQA